jgi:hypothetical protein
MMPYIKSGGRVLYDDSLDELVEELRANDNLDGDANYVISRIVAGAFEPEDGWRYANIARAIGVLECAKLELYRRVAAPYEEIAVLKNQDIPEYGKVAKWFQAIWHKLINVEPDTRWTG